MVLLEDVDPNVRWAAASALETKGRLEGLQQILEDPSQGVRRLSAGQRLARLGNEPAARRQRELLLEMLRQCPPDPATIQIAGEMMEREAVPLLLEALAKQAAPCRMAAAESLGKIHASEAIPHLVRRLNDEDFSVRSATISALGRIGTKDEVPALICFLGEPGFYWDIPTALAEIGAPEAVALLEHLLDSPRAREAAEALRTIRLKEAIPALRRQLADWRPYSRAAAARGLGEVEAVEAVTDLLPLLQDREHYVQLAAAEALCRLGSKEGIGVLLERRSSFWVLNHLRDPEIWGRLSKKRLGRDLERPREEVWEALERESGLRFEGRKASSFATPEIQISSRRGRTSLLWAFEEVLSGAEFVFENDHIRILSYEEAREFWLRWRQGKE